MEPGSLASIATVLGALSVAAERLVEIVKGFSSFLDQKNSDPRKERLRKVVLHALAVVAGIVSAYLARDALGGLLPGTWWDDAPVTATLALGFLASGGSGLWNSVLSYANKLKDVKSLEAEERKKRLQ